MSTSKDPAVRANAAVWRLTDAPPFGDDPNLACRVEGVDPEIFSATEGPKVEAAKAVCRSCPRQDDCLAWAIETDQRHDTWGGKTRAQRVAMANPRRKPGPAVHLIRHDQGVTDCCGLTAGELPRAKGHRLIADRAKATCPALSPDDTAEHLELP